MGRSNRYCSSDSWAAPKSKLSGSRNRSGAFSNHRLHHKDPCVHAEQPTRQPAHHSPGHHQGAKTPAETGRSGASTRSCAPSTPSSRSYHSARERRGTPTRTPPPAPSCNGGSTPPPSSAGSSPHPRPVTRQPGPVRVEAAGISGVPGRVQRPNPAGLRAGPAAVRRWCQQHQLPVDVFTCGMTAL